MKKILATLLILLVSFSLLANGSKESVETAPEKVTLTLACRGSEVDIKTYEDRAALVNAKFPDIELKVMSLPNDDYDAKIQTMLASGTAPDIIQVAESSNSYASKGLFTNLSPMAADAGIDLDARFGGATEAYIWKGNLYAMPDRSGAMVCYFNRDMFDAAGVPYPSKDWKWADFLDAAQKLTVTGDDGVVTQYGFAAGGWWPWWMSFMYQNGGRILDANMENVVVFSPENIEAINFYTDLVHKYGVAPSADDYSRFGLKDGQPDPLFAQGHCAMNLTGYWNIASLNSIDGLNWDIAPMWGNKEGATFQFGSGLAIPELCKYKEEAFKVVDYLTSLEGQTPIVTNNEDAPANVNLLKSDLFLNPSWASGKDINFGAFADSADILMSPPLHPKWNEIQRIFDENFSVLFQKGGDCTEAMKNIQAGLEEII